MTDRTGATGSVLLGVLVLLLAGWAYWPGQDGPPLLDDRSSVLVIGDLKEQPELAWDYVTGDKSGALGRPVSMASFVLEKMFLPEGTATSKRVNIILHLFNGVLVIGVFWLLFGHLRVPGYHYLAVVLGAAWLFAPLHVSTVLYIVQRMAMLCTTFMLVACISYLVWRRRLLRGDFSIPLLCGVGVSICLAVFAKENAVVVIPVLLLIEALWFQFEDGEGNTIRWLQRTVLIAIAVGGLGLVFMLVLDYENLAAGFTRRYFTLDERLMTQSRVVWDYVGQLYAPDVVRMGLYHDDIQVSTSLHNPPVTLYAVMAWSGVLLLSLALLFWQWGRYFVLGIGWFLLGHGVESTVFPLELYFEHRNYFPAVGLFLLPGILFALLIRYWPEIKAPLLVYFACYVVWLASLTGSQVQVWSSHPLLILNHLNGHPDSYRANADMAVQLANLGQFDAAREYSAAAFAVSKAGERSGDHDIRDLALACIANEQVDPARIELLGTDNPERPFGSVVTLQTLVHLLQDNACPDFDRTGFADRLGEIFLSADSPATASANIYLGIALLEHTLQRWENADAYIDLFLKLSPNNVQGLLMKLHFNTALGKVAAAGAARTLLLELQAQGKLTVGEQQTLSLYLEN